MSFGKITKIAASLSKHVNDSEKLSIHILAGRARKAFQEYPEDTTIGSMAQVLTSMSDRQSFITRAELNKMYNGFNVRNTHFREVFAEELGSDNVLQGPKMAEPESVVEEDYSKYADPVLANALASAFGGVPLKMYSQKVADKAVVGVRDLFSSFGFEPRVSLATGNKEFMIVQAEFDTPRGITNVYVPVETAEETVFEPSVFIGNDGGEDLNATSVKNYVQANAGNKLVVIADELLGAVSRLKVGSKEVVSSVELALTKMNASKQVQSGFFADQVTGQMVSQASHSDVVLPKVKDAEINSFAAMFDSPLGQANFAFGEKKVATARKSIERALHSFGHKTAQVVLTECASDKVVYAVNIGKTAFVVPVKIAENATPSADFFICNGKVRSLTQENVDSLFSSSELDSRASAQTSTFYGLKPSQLVEGVRQSMAEKNYAKAEDALNVLASSGDEKAYKVAMAEYFGGLNKTEVKATSSCTRIVKNASSNHTLCGHTGLPLHKVYQDANGDCLPLYRKSMDESYEGAAFMTNKIFL